MSVNPASALKTSPPPQVSAISGKPPIFRTVRGVQSHCSRARRPLRRPMSEKSNLPVAGGQLTQFGFLAPTSCDPGFIPEILRKGGQHCMQPLHPLRPSYIQEVPALGSNGLVAQRLAWDEQWQDRHLLFQPHPVMDYLC